MALTLIVIYSLVLIGASLRFFQSSSSTESYAIANRSSGIGGVFASTVTIIGGGELIAVASLAFVSDGAAIALLGGYGLGLIILGLLAFRLRKRATAQLYNTLPDYFYGEFGPAAGILASLVTFAAFFALLVLQFSAGTVVLTSLAPISPWVAAIASALIVGIYLAAAGFRGVVITDKIQLGVMVVGVPLLVFLLVPLGSIPSVLGSFDFSPVATLATILTGVFVILGSGDIWQRMYAAKSDSTAQAGLIWAGLGFTIFGFLLALVGAGARLENLTADPDSAFIAATLSIQNPILSALIILTVFSAILSTADTETFLLSGMIAREASRWKNGFKGTAETSDQVSVPLSRALVFVIALAGAVCSLYADNLVDTYTLLLSLLLVLAPPVLVGLFKQLRVLAVNVSVALGATLLLGLVSAGYLDVGYAVLVIIPGLIICTLLPSVVK